MNELIQTTADHPFFTPSFWKPAKDLETGDSIYNFAGNFVVVDSTAIKDTTCAVYNFTVNDFHTYFVGNIGLGVHNDCFLKPWKEFFMLKSIMSDYANDIKPTLGNIKNYLTNEEGAVLYYYTTGYGGNNIVNTALRTSYGMTNEVISYKELLDEALSKLPNNPNPSIVYKGYNQIYSDINPEILNVGDVWPDKAFLSCSASRLIAVKNSGDKILLEIEHTSGKYIQEISAHPGEQEVLFTLETNFKITYIEQQNNNWLIKLKEK